MAEQLCLLCGGTGIDAENSFPAEGPSEYSLGEPGWLEPCICAYLPEVPVSHPCQDCGTPWFWDQPACLNRRCPTHYGDWWCPCCGVTWAEKHPHNFILRCANCKEWLADGDGQLFIFTASQVEESERKRDSHGCGIGRGKPVYGGKCGSFPDCTCGSA